MKKLRTGFGAAVAAAMLATTISAAGAAEIPCKTAKLIVPWGAGGGTHVIFSLFEETINRLDVQPKVQVVTIPGQGGNKGAKEAAKAKADGCTLFAIHQSAITSYLNGRIDFTWDAFEPVAQLTSTPDMLGASGKTPWKSLDDMKSEVMAKPGEISVGATFGSTSQFMWLILEDMMGLKFKYVPFDGTAERNTALLANTIQLGSTNVATARKFVEGGEMKALAIAAAERSKYAPDVPTLKELGVDLIYALNRGIMAPKGTPADVVEQWAQIFKKAAEDPELIAALEAKGTDVEWVGPADYRAWFEKSYAEHEKVAVKIGMFKKN